MAADSRGSEGWLEYTNSGCGWTTHLTSAAALCAAALHWVVLQPSQLNPDLLPKDQAGPPFHRPSHPIPSHPIPSPPPVTPTRCARLTQRCSIPLPAFRRCRSCYSFAPAAVVFPLLLAHTAAAGGSRAIVDFAHFCKIFDECSSNTHVRRSRGCALRRGGAGQRAAEVHRAGAIHWASERGSGAVQQQRTFVR